MLYITYLSKFKDKISKEILVVIAVILAVAFIAVTFETHKRFITGGEMSILEYGLILVTIYLVLNVVVAIRDESDEGKRIIAEGKKVKDKVLLVIDYTDSFIFNKLKFYDYRNERSSLIPVFVSGETEPEPPDETMEFTTETTMDFGITNTGPQDEPEENREEDISEMSEEERRQKLRDELLNGF